MDIESSLQELGLTKNESKVYIALLDIGNTTTSSIIKKTGVNTSKVYESLERLLKKGLVSYTIIQNKKNWQTENPNSILKYLEDEKIKFEEKKSNCEKMVVDLIARRNILKENTEYKIYEGINGIKTAREHVLDVLNKDETFYIILSSYPKDDKLEAYWADFQKRRAKKEIRCKYLLNQTLKTTGTKRMHLKLTDIRYVNSEVLSPTWMEIYKDYVTIGVLGTSPSVFVIKNEAVAKGFLNYFNTLWKTGVK